jgi:hypothetical protein
MTGPGEGQVEGLVGQLSELSWIRAAGGGRFGILIAGYPAPASLRVP